MDAIKIADAMALDLLVEGRARPSVLLPLLESLESHVHEPQLGDSIRRLRLDLAAVDPSDEATGEADDALCALAVDCVDRVRRYLESRALDAQEPAPQPAGPAAVAAQDPTATKHTPGIAGSSEAAAPAATSAGAPPAQDAPVVERLTYDTTCDRAIQQAFFAEASEHLLHAEHEVIHLENNPDDRESLDQLFRSMHSLKGISGYIALKAVRHIAHDAEAILARARSAAEGLGREECDALLLAVDLLSQMVSAVQSHAEKPQASFPPLPAAYDAVQGRLSILAALGPRAAAAVQETAARALAKGARPGEPALTQDASPLAELSPPGPAGPASASLGVRPSIASGASPGSSGSPGGTGPQAPGADPPAVDGAPSSLQPAHRRDRSGMVRVRVGKLDRLIDSIGELVLTQSQVSQDPQLAAQGDTPLQEKIAHMANIARDLHSIAMSLRMVPLRELFGPMTRIARDLAREQGKDLEVVVHGGQTELDKGIVDGLTDPLTHLIRNAVDHGMELPERRVAAGKPARGRITLTARHRAGEVIVEVSDDGNGLDPDRILAKGRELGLVGATEEPSMSDLCQLIFKPGFSTAQAVTSVSGRGVGLDVVRGNVEGLGGRLYVHSSIGKHTTFTLTLPLTLAILDGLSVRAAQQTYLVPVATVAEIFRPSPDQIVKIPQAGECLAHRGRQIRVVRLCDLIPRGALPVASPGTPPLAIVIETHNDRYGLLVDELLGHHQVLLKSLGEPLTRVKGIAGGAILGDGRVCLVLDVATLSLVHRPEAAA